MLAHEKVAIAICSLLAAVLAVRGLHAIITEDYQSTSKYGNITHLQGNAAMYAGAAYVFLAGIIGAGIYYQRYKHKQRAFLFGGMMLAGSVFFFVCSMV